MSNHSPKSFHLRWNNHLPNLSALIEVLYSNQSFVDVTLSCKDGLLKAHRLVLSACSPYFDTILRENPCEHPTVILRGISLREMQLIIEYMYLGSVDIPENELNDWLAIANELHVKGLVQDPVDEEIEKNDAYEPDSDKSDFAPSNERSSPDTGKNYPAQQKKDTSPNHRNLEVDHPACGIMNIAQVKMEEEQSEKNEAPKDESFNFEFSEQSSYMNDLFCTICNREFLSKQNMKRHMQTHSGVKPHQCDYCNLSFLRLSHLQRHHRVHTGERPFKCNQCDKNFSRSDKLKQHVSQHHSGMIVPKPAKQRGRPRKVTVNTPRTVTPQNDKIMGLTIPENTTITGENGEIISVANYPNFQQIYAISDSMNPMPGPSREMI